MAVVPDARAGGAGLHAPLRAQPVARDRPRVLRTPGALRHAGAREHPGRARHPRGHQLSGEPPQQALGPDGGAPVHALRPDEEGAPGTDQAGACDGVRANGGLRAVPHAARGVPVRVEAAAGRVRRPREAAGARGAAQGERARHDRVRVRRPRPARHVRRRAGHHQRPDQGDPGAAAQGVFRPGPRRARHGQLGGRRLQRDRAGAGVRQLHHRAAGAAPAGHPRRRVRPGARRPEDRPAAARGRQAEGVPRQGRQAARPGGSAAARRRAAADQPARAAEGLVD